MQFFLQLATCSATTTNKKPLKLQRGCHTFATFFATSNACTNNQDSGRAKRAKDELWLAHSDKIALQVAEGMLHASNLSQNVAKSGGSFCFCCNSQRSNCKMGCYTWLFLATCNARLSIRLMCSAAFDAGLTIGRYELIHTLLIKQIMKSLSFTHLDLVCIFNF